MLAWMVYVVVVTLLLSIAAFVAECSARRRRAASRWIWLIAIVASLALPTFVASVSVQIPNLFKPTVAQKLIVLRDATTVRLPAMIPDVTFAGQTSASRPIDSLLPYLWSATSFAILMALVLSAALLYRRKRTWAKGNIDGTPVYVAPDVGPAVVGLLHPRIVVPTWLMQATPQQQRLVMAHEQSHLDAHDPQMLSVALCLLVTMPWNLPLWWQLHRLRRAIEVDCDARVLHAGRDVTHYCETLIEVGQHRSAYIGTAAAMSESKSFLEQRIKIMVLKPAKWARVSAAIFACFSIGVAAVAAQVSPPNASISSTNQAVVVSPSTLAQYVGAYQFGELSVLTVTLNGTQLTAQLSGQGPIDIFPNNDTDFFMKVVNAKIDFVRDAQGHATALVLHQNGYVTTAPRIDAANAAQINHALATRVAGQQPFPGSEKALKLLLSDPDDSAGMSPRLAQARNEQRQARHAYLAQLGPVTSFEFLGVNGQGWDKYLVRRAHGTEEVSLLLDSKGTIVSAHRQP